MADLHLKHLFSLPLSFPYLVISIPYLLTDLTAFICSLNITSDVFACSQSFQAVSAWSACQLSMEALQIYCTGHASYFPYSSGPPI